MNSNNGDETTLTNALLAFNAEAALYVDGISNTVAKDYAMQYARLIQNRAKGIEPQFDRMPLGLFEPDRNLIRSILDKMGEKYFSAK